MLCVFSSQVLAEIVIHFLQSSRSRYFSGTLLAKILVCELLLWNFPLVWKGKCCQFLYSSLFRERPSFLQSSRWRYFSETLLANVFVCELFLWDLSRHCPIFVWEVLCVFALQFFAESVPRSYKVRTEDIFMDTCLGRSPPSLASLSLFLSLSLLSSCLFFSSSSSSSSSSSLSFSLSLPRERETHCRAAPVDNGAWKGRRRSETKREPRKISKKKPKNTQGRQKKLVFLGKKTKTSEVKAKH